VKLQLPNGRGLMEQAAASASTAKRSARRLKMFPVKKILCPIDFSKPSFEGLKVALEIAEKDSAELILVHVVQPVQPVPAPGVPAGYGIQDYYEERSATARKSFDEIVAQDIPQGVAVRTEVARGQAADEIVREAESEKVNMIVTSTHGWTGWRRFMFGSVAERVIRLASCPVLIIPDPGKSKQPVSGNQ
jgi:nucleotide-binding universal stress UspA family protein